MKKLFNYGSLLAKLLFVIVLSVVIAAEFYAAQYVDCNTIFIVELLALFVIAVLGYHIQKLEKAISMPTIWFSILWFLGFAVELASSIWCMIISKPNDYLAAYIMGFSLFALVVAVDGYLFIVGSQPEK